MSGFNNAKKVEEIKMRGLHRKRNGEGGQLEGKVCE